MKEKFIRFMQGRYGADSLTKFLVITGVIVACLSSISKVRSLYLLAWVFIIFAYFRMFSKDYAKRSAENQLFLKKTYKLRCKFAGWKRRLGQIRQYHIYKCPSCKQKIRIPRGKGKIEIRCPKCNETFVKKS
ncbi:MAG: hypothetical protein HFH53_09895 [Hespellia sp.]|jgi:DNA-directed RNA polymerase subunit RPC12/RpoP|nr:hypothetical protein [Hespellia sp.]